MSGSNSDDINSKMIYAALRNHFIDLKKYVNEGADVNYYSTNECTNALDCAIHYGNIEMVDFLIENGANLYFNSHFVDPPLHVAAQNNYIDLLKYLLEKGLDKNTIDKIGRTCLHVAIIYGNYEIVKLLLSYNFDLNYSTYYGCSYLHYSGKMCLGYNDDGIFSNDKKIYSLLIKTYFDITSNQSSDI